MDLLKESQFCVNLEKKRKPGLIFNTSSWLKRKFILKGTTLSYFEYDKPVPICFITQSISAKLSDDVQGGKMFLFKLSCKDGSLHIFNAFSEESREKCIAVFNYASSNHKWINPFEGISEKGGIAHMNIVSDGCVIQKRMGKHDLSTCQVATVDIASTLMSPVLKSEVYTQTTPPIIEYAEAVEQTKTRRFSMSKKSFLNAMRRYQSHISKGDSNASDSTNETLQVPKEAVQIDENERKRQLLVKVQRLWRSKSSREQVIHSIASHSDVSCYNTEQMEILAWKIQCKFRIYQAKKVFYSLQQTLCPQIILLSIDSFRNEKDNTKHLTAQVSGMVSDALPSILKTEGSISSHSTTSVSSRCENRLNGLGNNCVSIFDHLSVSQKDSFSSVSTMSVTHNVVNTVAMVTHTSAINHLKIRLSATNTSFLGHMTSEVIGVVDFDVSEIRSALIAFPSWNPVAKLTVSIKKEQLERSHKVSKKSKEQTKQRPSYTSITNTHSYDSDSDSVRTSDSDLTRSAQIVPESLSGGLRTQDSYDSMNEGSMDVKNVSMSIQNVEVNNEVKNDEIKGIALVGAVTPDKNSRSVTVTGFKTKNFVCNVMVAQTMFKKTRDKTPSVCTENSNALVGSISLTACLVDMTYAMCGWMSKYSEVHSSFMTSKPQDTYKRRWFVLVNNHLQYFDSNMSLDQPKHTVLCSDITSIVIEKSQSLQRRMRITFREIHSSYGGKDGLKGRNSNVGGQGRQDSGIQKLNTTHGIAGKSGEKVVIPPVTTEWILRWDDMECIQIIQMWIRKLYRACPLLIDPTLSEAAVLSTVRPTRKGTARHGCVPTMLQPKR